MAFPYSGRTAYVDPMAAALAEQERLMAEATKQREIEEAVARGFSASTTGGTDSGFSATTTGADPVPPAQSRDGKYGDRGLKAALENAQAEDPATLQAEADRIAAEENARRQAEYEAELARQAELARLAELEWVRNNGVGGKTNVQLEEMGANLEVPVEEPPELPPPPPPPELVEPEKITTPPDPTKPINLGDLGIDVSGTGPNERAARWWEQWQNIMELTGASDPYKYEGLRKLAYGEMPSAAELQMQQGLRQNQMAMQSAAAGMRGGNAGGNVRALANAMSTSGLELNEALARQRAQEQAQYMGAYESAMGDTERFYDTMTNEAYQNAFNQAMNAFAVESGYKGQLISSAIGGALGAGGLLAGGMAMKPTGG